MPALSPSTFFLSKTGLVSSSWDRQFYFTQGGNLMSQARGDVAGGLVMDIDNCSVMAVDCEDRRYCFQITSFDGKKFVFILSYLIGGWLGGEGVQIISKQRLPAKRCFRRCTQVFFTVQHNEKVASILDQVTVTLWLTKQRFH